MDLSKKSLFSLFAKYVSLNMLGMAGLSCYILADTFFIANGVGSAGLTALNLVLPVYSFISGTGLMLGMGGATAFAIQCGKGNREKARDIFAQTLLFSCVTGLLLTLAGAILAFNLAELLGAKGAILPLAGTYLKTVMLFSFAFILNNVLLCFVRNDGEPALAMSAMLIGSLSNIGLDYVFIFPCNMGIFGAAFATGLAPVISIFILSLHWLRGKSSLGLPRIPRPLHHTTLRLICSDLRRILALGVPSFVTEFSSGIIMLFFNFTILSLAGNTGVAAYGVIANLALIVIAIFTGAAQGLQPLVSLSFGQGNTAAVNRLLRMALILAAALGAFFWLLGLLFPDTIASLFNRDGDPTLAQIARTGILLYFPAFLPAGLNILASSWLTASERPAAAMTISALRGGALVIPAVLILPRIFGMHGVWLSIPLTELLTLAAVVYFLRNKKQRRQGD